LSSRFWGADIFSAANSNLIDAEPVGVLDIGSNSIRLVVYERHARALTPMYNEKAAAALGRGLAATGALMAGVNADQLPVMLAGSSRGTMATGWAMTRNFDRACDYDLPDMPCAPAAGLSNIKGAMLLASFVSGPGYLTWPTTQSDTDRGLFIGGSELRYHIVFFPSSAVLAGIHTWPALFIGRGLWDYAESLRGSIDAYDRVSGLKELVVVRAPHPFEVWPEAERERVAARMIAFARAAVLGWSSVPGGRPWSTMKELVATSSDLWEVSSFPRR